MKSSCVWCREEVRIHFFKIRNLELVQCLNWLILPTHVHFMVAGVCPRCSVSTQLPAYGWGNQGKMAPNFGILHLHWTGGS